ncbi:hypothetical protein [Fimbriimonas ginsengisoli]|uniref:Uncharacterized protein n=1 Tax=Fimbriimonas ginsengisoli Gsoil 348 TaxID=661478 RepID=A0A068NT93_FIMGI|nr:hypothetical protein [Fimbriimonas ginsengisoli]AIE86641.1 hypothetical protein OP10G_3273 [Fimbriimonas ginsengisoli Gsoil 348]
MDKAPIQSAPLADIKRLPIIDYDAHPAYGKAFPKPTLKMRVKALMTLAPWMGFVLGKRLAKMDRIPALPSYSGHISGGLLGRFRALPKYLPYILNGYKQDLVGLFSASQHSKIDPKFKSQADEFVETGFLVGDLEENELEHLQQLVAKPIADLRKSRAEATERTFVGNTRFFNTGDDKELFDAMNTYMEKHGMLAAAGAYIGRPVKVTHLLIQINDPNDKYFHGNFVDVNLPDSPCKYMHVDKSYDMVKCVVYLNQVGMDNGAFSFVLGSQKVRPLGFEGVLRRAVDRAGLSGSKPEIRRMFMALPKFLRKKCTFGLDLLEGTPDCDAMLKSELYLTSEMGNIGLFANNGVHRGGLTKTGERIVFFATIA